MHRNKQLLKPVPVRAGSVSGLPFLMAIQQARFWLTAGLLMWQAPLSQSTACAKLWIRHSLAQSSAHLPDTLAAELQVDMMSLGATPGDRMQAHFARLELVFTIITNVQTMFECL